MDALKYFFKLIDTILACAITLGLLFAWLLGFVFAHGFWSSLSCIFPFWAWYLCVEKLAIFLHWV